MRRFMKAELNEMQKVQLEEMKKRLDETKTGHKAELEGVKKELLEGIKQEQKVAPDGLVEGMIRQEQKAAWLEAKVDDIQQLLLTVLDKHLSASDAASARSAVPQ